MRPRDIVVSFFFVVFAIALCCHMHDSAAASGSLVASPFSRMSSHVRLAFIVTFSFFLLLIISHGR